MLHEYCTLFLQATLFFSLRVLLSFCLILSQFQPDVAHKIVAYKKSVHMENEKRVEKYLKFRKENV